AAADFLFRFGELHVTFGVQHFFGRFRGAVGADFGVLFGFRRDLFVLLPAGFLAALALALVGVGGGRFFGGRGRFGRFPAAPSAAADFDHLDRRFGGRVAAVVVAGAADQEADADRQDERRDARDQGGVGVHAVGRPRFARRRGRRRAAGA